MTQVGALSSLLLCTFEALEALSTAALPNKHEKQKYEVMKWSRKWFYKEAGYTQRKHLTAMWISKCPAISDFSNNVITAKTDDFNTILRRTKHILANLNPVLHFYLSKRFKHLSFKTYIRNQKTYEKNVHNLTGGEKDTLVICGGASFPS